MSVPKKGLQVSPSSPILFKPRKPQLDNDHFWFCKKSVIM